MKLSKIIFLCGLWSVVCGLFSCKQRPNESRDVTTYGNQIYSDTSSSSVKVFDQNGRVCIQQSNIYYEVMTAYDGVNKVPLLLKIRKTELCYADSINKDKVYDITAKSVSDSKYQSWTAQFVATSLQNKDNNLLAIHEGMDEQEDYFTRFSLLDGKEVFGSSYGELKVAIPNVKDKRFIGFTSRRAAANPLKSYNEENLLGVIRYASSSAPINSLKLKVKRTKIAAKLSNSTPDMVLVPLNANTTAIEDGKQIILMKADEHYTSKDVRDFAVKITYYYGDDNESANIIIPVNDDRLDLGQAKYDKEIFELTTP